MVKTKNHAQCSKRTFLVWTRFAAHEDGIWAGAWTKSLKDGSEHIISGSIDDKVKIWSWYKEKLELKYTCTGHRLGIVSVDVNPQGTGSFVDSIHC
jgi:WD40 repeat protein